MSKVIYYIASLFAVICVLCPHEFAHAYVAYKNGDPTAKFSGRMTLNPLKHIDPVGFVLCALVGYGWARPVPVNPSNFRKRKVGLFTTAIAGVVTNYIIAFLAYPLYLVTIRFLTPYASASLAADFFISLIYWLFFLIYAYSLYAFTFNLLPLYPLDGFRVVQSFTREINPVHRFLRNYGQFILIILVLWSFFCNIMTDYVPIYINGEYVPIFQYVNVMYYVGWFATNILGFPITAVWDWILTV